MRAHMHKPQPGEAATEDDDSANRRRGVPGRAAVKPAPTARRDEPKRRTGKLSVSQALSGDEGARMRSLAAVKRAREKEKRHLMAQQPQAKVVRDVVLPETITVQELASRMAERGADVIKSLMKMGVMATINQVIDADTAELIVTEFGHKMRRVTEGDVEIGLLGVRGRGRPSGRAPADRHHHGPRRPRQDLAARCAARRPTSPRTRPAASPSISAPIR